MPISFQRPFVATLTERFSAEKPLIQVLAGPRQVGKTTGVKAMAPAPEHYVEIALDVHDDNLARRMRGKLVGELLADQSPSIALELLSLPRHAPPTELS